MDYIIENLEDISLSNQELMKLVDHKAKLITYTDLASCNSIDQVLEPYGACIILFLTREHYGHWCCLFKVEPDTLEFFDPYGLKPDDELDFEIDPYFRKYAKEDYPHLTYLLYHSKYKISYNHYKFQKRSSDIKTCGRHVAVRLLLRRFDLDTYIKIIKSSKYDPDETVTMLTAMA